MDTKKEIRKSLMKSSSIQSDVFKLIHEIKKNPIEPFKFLSHVLDQVNSEDHSSLRSIKPTDIDFQLAFLVKRVEMNISLLQRTNQRVKDINFSIEKNKILASRELNYNKETLSKLDECELKAESNIEHPEIDKIQRTMHDTLEIINCIKKITLTDPDLDKLSSEFFNKLEIGSNSCQSGELELKMEDKRE